HPERREGMNPYKLEIAARTNRRGLKGGLAEALTGADAFIGVSAPNVLRPEDIRRMAPRPIVFALANPDPEIRPAEAAAAGAAVVATGRSDYPNQINNVLAFPGIFRGVLDVRATDINDEMKLAAARAIAGVVKSEALSPDHIIPKPLDPDVAPVVAAAVAEAAWATGVARVYLDPATVARRVRELTAA
ncbi:MAG: NAD-dependent malic enzyme, partial [Firmicutes bacterium]|nr:NAD-dependent malic enzyme [Bacillota bacterium]